MARYKNLGKKLRLIKKGRQNRPMPFWVVMRTKRRVTRNPLRHFWRRGKLKR